MLHSFGANINSEPPHSSLVWKFRLPLSCWAGKKDIFLVLMTSLHWQAHMYLVTKRKMLLSASHFSTTFITMHSNHPFSFLCSSLDCKMLEDRSCYLYTNIPLVPNTIKIIAIWHEADLLRWIILFKIWSSMLSSLSKNHLWREVKILSQFYRWEN